MSFNTFNDNGTYTTIYSPNELVQIVTDNLNWYKKQADTWQKRAMELKEDAKAIVEHEYEEQIKRLKERLRLSYGEFASQKEKDAYNQFVEEHMHDRATSKYNSGRAPYLIPTYTGLGPILKVVCPICGESEDITDMEAW